MPVVLKIDPHRRVVHSAFYGKITDAELLGHRTRIASDPDFNSQFADIVDFSDVTDPDITENAIGALAANPSLFSSSALSHCDCARCGYIPAGCQVQGTSAIIATEFLCREDKG